MISMTDSNSSSCRRFRAQHRAWVDLELEERAGVAMERHAVMCATCSAHDTRVRRALLVMRNLPEYRPSRHFKSDFEVRLAREKSARHVVANRHRPPTMRTMAALAASLVAMAWLAQHRPPVGLPIADRSTVMMPNELPPVPMPTPMVRSAPLREGASVRVVSVRTSAEPSWTPTLPPSTPVNLGASLVLASYSQMIGR